LELIKTTNLTQLLLFPFSYIAGRGCNVSSAKLLHVDVVYIVALSRDGKKVTWVGAKSSHDHLYMEEGKIEG
jgi:hypothetical protein